MEINALSHLAWQAFPWLADTAIKGLVLMAGAGLAALAVRRASAAIRHLVRLIALVGLLCLPLLACVLPAWHPPALFAAPSHFSNLPAANVDRIQPPSAQESAGSASSDHNGIAPKTAVPLSVTPPAEENRAARKINSLPWQAGTVMIWLLGTGVLLMRLVWGLMSARRLLGQCRPAINGSLTVAARQTQTLLDLKRSPTLYLGIAEAVPPIPMTMGMLRSAILLPAGAEGWPPERLEAVLLHEMAHIRRADWLTQVLALLACALYWLLPPVWLLAKRLRTESEYACDDLVLDAGMRPSAYAGQLLEIVEGLGRQPSASLSMVAMAQHSEIKSRLHAILREGNNRQIPTRRALLGALAVALGLLLPLAAWQPTAKAQNASRMPAPHQEPAVQTIGKPIVASQWNVIIPSNRGPVRARLESISGKVDDRGAGSWQPDGSGLKMYPPGTRVNPDSPGGRVIVLRVTFPSPQMVLNSMPTFGILGANSYSYGGAIDRDRNGHRKNDLVIVQVEAFPPTQKQATMALQIAPDARNVIIAGSPRLETTKPLGAGEMATLSKVAVGSARSLGKTVDVLTVRTTIPTRFVKDCDFNLEFIGKNGKLLPARHMGYNLPDTSGPQTTLRFNARTAEVPPAQIKTVRFVSRPIRTVVFPNIALQPNHAGK